MSEGWSLFSQLPNEITTYIFHFVGVDFFREDLTRLTVCKTWRVFAEAELQAHVTLKGGVWRQKDLFLSSQLFSQGLPTHIKDVVKTLSLEVRAECGYITHDSPQDSEERIECFLEEPAFKPIFGLPNQLQCLAKLDLKIEVTTNPVGLIQRTPGGLPERPFQRRTVYESLERLSRTSLPNIRELSVCISGKEPLGSLPDYRKCACEAINKTLCRFSSLRTVRLRLALLCEKLFKYVPPEGSLCLNELRVYCDLPNDYDRVQDEFFFALNCAKTILIPDVFASEYAGCANDLAKSLAEAARRFTHAMKNPSSIYVVWPDVQSGQARYITGQKDPIRLYAWDCLKNRVTTFPMHEGPGAMSQAVDLAEEVRNWESKFADLEAI